MASVDYIPEDFTEVEHINTEDYEEDTADN